MQRLNRSEDIQKVLWGQLFLKHPVCYVVLETSCKTAAQNVSIE